MAETKQEERQRIILHKRKKENLRQQQKIIDALMKEPESKFESIDDFGTGSKLWYSMNYVIEIKRSIIDLETTA